MAAVDTLPIASPSFVPVHPLQLDISCPLALPSRQNATPLGWPITSPVPDRAPLTLPQAYLSTLLLPDILAPLSLFTSDLCANPISAREAGALLLPLPEIERRHRRLLLPLLAALLDGTSSPELKRAKIEDAAALSGLDSADVEAVRACVELRAGSRDVVDGRGVVVPRKLAEELERREVFLQTVLTLVYLPHAPTPCDVQPEKKRKRRRKRDSGQNEPAVVIVDPRTHPAEALEVLFDRMAVWMAVAELGMGLGLGLGLGLGSDMSSIGTDVGLAGMGKGKGREEEGVGAQVRRFWHDVIRPNFLATLPEICATFHLKVFNAPLNPPSTKKPRKPHLTRARRSTDDVTAPIAVSTSTIKPSISSGQQQARKSSLDRSTSLARGVLRPSETIREWERERERSQSRSSSMQRIPSRSLSRAASEVSLRLSPPPVGPYSGTGAGTDLTARPHQAEMRRSASHTSHASLEQRMRERRSRSRSESIDFGGTVASTSGAGSMLAPAANLMGQGAATGPARRIAPTTSGSALTRQPSGRDLFKGREVGFMRRSASGVLRRDKDRDREGESIGQSGAGQGQGQGHGQSQGGTKQGQSQSQSQSQSSKGLFGRKTSDPHKRGSTLPGAATAATAASSGSSSTTARPNGLGAGAGGETLIMATPSKPKGRYALASGMGMGMGVGVGTGPGFGSDGLAQLASQGHGYAYAHPSAYGGWQGGHGGGYGYGQLEGHASGYAYGHGYPTPIPEESTGASGGRGVKRVDRVAETPVAPRVARGPGAMQGAGAGGSGRGMVGRSLFGARSKTSGALVDVDGLGVGRVEDRGDVDEAAEEEEEDEDGDEDGDAESLGGLMVPTDDEDEGGDDAAGGTWRGVPETPVR